MTDKQKRRIEDRLPGQPLEWEGADESINLTEEDVKLLKAADEYAASYEGDDRACIQADVINAFCAGYAFAGKALTESDRAIEAEVLAQAGVRAEPAAPVQPLMLVPKWAGYFHSYQDWVNKAQTRLASPDYRRAICVDAKGRRCAIGKDFMLARDEGTFPVRYFWECELIAQVPAAEVRAQALREAAEVCDQIRREQNAMASEQSTDADGDELYAIYTNKAIAASKCANAIRALAQSSTADKASEVRADEWISVEERMPEKECLAVYVTPNGKQRLIRAKYARQFQIEAEGDDCETEYNDDDDTFYIKAGWLECIDNWGEYSSCYVVEGTVTHWMNLPAAPSTAVSGDTSALSEGAEA